MDTATLSNSRLQLAAKISVRLWLGATRDSLALATIVLLAPVWHADEVTAETDAAAAEAQAVMRSKPRQHNDHTNKVANP